MRPLENLGEVGRDTETRKVCSTPFMKTVAVFSQLFTGSLSWGSKKVNHGVPRTYFVLHGKKTQRDQ